VTDTNIPTDPGPGDWDIADELYGGSLELRIQQGMEMGIGRCRALDALGLKPDIYHLD
jgi:starch phosphorylase